MIKHYTDITQGTEEWLKVRLGKLTASTMKRLITPKRGQPAKNSARTALMHEILAQRITGFADATYTSNDMLRGTMDEEVAIQIYALERHPVHRCGFIENDFGVFMDYPIGYSPDGLVGDDGLVEVKSKCPKLQVETIIKGDVPEEHVVQLQTGLMVSGRAWIDFVSYCGGLPMPIIRVYPDTDLQQKILILAQHFEKEVQAIQEEFVSATVGMITTERQDRGDIF